MGLKKLLRVGPYLGTICSWPRAGAETAVTICSWPRAGAETAHRRYPVWPNVSYFHVPALDLNFSILGLVFFHALQNGVTAASLPNLQVGSFIPPFFWRLNKIFYFIGAAVN